MKNVETLVIAVDLVKESGASKAGMSITIASTEGNVSVPGNEEIKTRMNGYRKM